VQANVEHKLELY